MQSYLKTRLLGQLQYLYHKYRIARYLMYSAPFCASGLLFWAIVNTLPQSWRLLIQALSIFPRLLMARGPLALLIVLILIVQIVAWPILWGLFLWTSVTVLRFLERERLKDTPRPASQNWQRARPLAGNANSAITPPEKVTEAMLVLPTIQLEKMPEAVPVEAEPFPLASMSTASTGTSLRNFVPEPTFRPPSPLEFSEPQPLETPPSTGPLVAPQFLRMRVGTGSDAGIVRKQQPNEDNLVAIQGTRVYPSQAVPFGLFAVADGIGSHAYGREASRLAAQTTLEAVLPRLLGNDNLIDDTLMEIMLHGIRQANRVIYQRNLKDGTEMGTTLAAGLIFTTKAYVVNVGDSRVYHYRPGQGLKQITQDHSLVARLIAEGQLTPADAYTHPDRHLIYRSLGEYARVTADPFLVPLQQGDCLLFCSDGLWEMVRDGEIEEILAASGNNPAQASATLIQAALQNGGEDNISVIVVGLS